MDEFFTIIVTLLVALLLMCRGVFVSNDVGVQALENQSYTNIRVIDNVFFFVGFRGCEGTDAARITATATNQLGKDVTLYVCAGWPFKGATVRNP